jgi:SAM-dependent methyltransferase
VNVFQQARLLSGRLKARLEQFATTPRQRRLVLANLQPGVWSVDNFSTRADGRLLVQGWAALTDADSSYTLLLDGQRPDVLEIEIERPDLGSVFPYVPRSPHLGYQAEFSSPGAMPAEIVWADKTTMQPIRGWQSVFMPPPVEKWPLPDAKRMSRAHSASHTVSYRLVGFSAVRKIDLILQATQGRGIETFQRILDWGCGCGRVLRYLTDISGPLVMGADIDSDNLQWLSANIPAATYVQLALHPPSPLPSNSLDLVIGISVFTHLNEQVQFEWLEELRRVLKPGGVAVVTVHGATAAAMSGRSSLVRRVADRGFVAAPSYYVLHEYVNVSNYYGTTYHTHAYIRENWGRFFHVHTLVDACIGNVQDVVVMVAR